MLTVPSFPCGDGHTVRYAEHTTLAAYTDTINTLVSVGWHRCDTHALAGNRFDTLRRKRDGAIVCGAYYAASQTARFVSGPAQFLPRVTSEMTAVVSPMAPPMRFERVVTPTVTQLGRNGAAQSAAGLSLVIQLCDGRFLLVDGGPRDDTDTDAMLAFLQDHAPRGQRPTIAAWFITHAHKDHVGLAGEFLMRHGDRVTVELVAYNFPDFENITIEHESPAAMAGFAAPFCEQAKRRGIPHWRLHAGQRIAYPACTVEVLYTHEEHGSAVFPWGNHTSCALRLTTENKRLLILGDCETVGCEHLARHFGEELRCDILQLSHHGLNGATEALYQLADPAVCLWPIDGARFETHPICRGEEPYYRFNAWIRDDTIRPRTHVHASETRTFEL